MIIGFLGKGGSGKSTTSAAFCEYVLCQKNKVLAVDADHNMDLLFNLGVQERPRWLGDSMSDLLKFGGLSEGRDNYRNFFDISPRPAFRLSPMDAFTKAYTKRARPNLWVMAGGPHSQEVLHDKACSHMLTTPLKVLLPFFELNNHEFLVIDEKAGSDGAGTGIASGLDFGVIVLEPSPHGIKAASQIASILDFFGTPHCFIVNKVDNNDVLDRVKKRLPQQPVMTLPFDSSVSWGDGADDHVDGNEAKAPRWDFSPLIEFANRLPGVDPAGAPRRYKRALSRVVRNRKFAAKTSI